MSIHLSLPTGERRTVKIDLNESVFQLQEMVCEMMDVRKKGIELVFRLQDVKLEGKIALRTQGVVPGAVIEVEIEGNVPLACTDIAKRRRSQEDWRVFFTDLMQRLIPDNESFSPDYIRSTLTGIKETLRLLDVRDYKFPLSMYSAPELQPEKLLNYCLKSDNLRNFVGKDCKDQKFLIKVIASLDYGHIKSLHERIKSKQTQNKAENVVSKRTFQGKKRPKRVGTPLKQTPNKHICREMSDSEGSTLEVVVEQTVLQPVIPILQREVYRSGKSEGKTAYTAIELD